MKLTTTTCDRCGAVILEGGAVLDVRAGSLRGQLHTSSDLCKDCGPLLLDFLRGGRQASQDGLGEALMPTAVASMATGATAC